MDDAREDGEGGSRVSDGGSGWSRDADAERDVVTVEWDDVGRPTFDIVEAVAAATGRDPFELPPLHDTVDTDAVAVLLRGDAADVRLSFTYAGASVVVESGGSIEVRRVGA